MLGIIIKVPEIAFSNKTQRPVIQRNRQVQSNLLISGFVVPFVGVDVQQIQHIAQVIFPYFPPLGAGVSKKNSYQSFGLAWE